MGETFATSSQSLMPLLALYAVVNAVSLYDVHGMKCLMSMLNRFKRNGRGSSTLSMFPVSGSDPRPRSLYIRKRGEGELAVLGAFANAIIIRPAVMFSPDDAFLTTILKLLQRLPIYPMFGSNE